MCCAAAVMGMLPPSGSDHRNEGMGQESRSAGHGPARGLDTSMAYYVGYNVDGFEVALNPAGAGGGPVAFADVDDRDATPATLLAAGATERDAPRQVAPGARVCVLADADGNPIGLRGV